MIREYRHLNRCSKCFLYFTFRSALLFHCPISLALSYRPVQNSFYLSSSKSISKRSIWLCSVLFRKSRLKIIPHMLQYGLLSILLHSGIYCCKNLQTICIHIIRFTILLMILITPAIQRISLPCQGINCKLNPIPRWIIFQRGFLSHNVLS